MSKIINICSFSMLGSIALLPMFAQGPVGDEVMVTLDKAARVGSQVLPAGKYTIQQVTSASNPRVLQFTSDDGTKLQATVTAIPILKNDPPAKTRVVIDDEGGTSRISEIWVQGQSYGYGFPGKSSTGTAGANQTARLKGSFSPRPQPAQVAETPAPKPADESAAPAPAPQQAAAEPAPEAAPAPAPAPAPEPQPAATPSPAATQTQSAPADMPATALGWKQLLWQGSAIALLAGLFLLTRKLYDRA